MKTFICGYYDRSNSAVLIMLASRSHRSSRVISVNVKNILLLFARRAIPQKKTQEIRMMSYNF